MSTTFTLGAQTFNATDAHGDRFISEIDGWDGADLRGDFQERLNDHGQTLLDAGYSGREVIIHGVGLPGTGRGSSDLQGKLEALVALAYQESGALKLLVNESTPKYLYVVRGGKLRLRWRGPKSVEFELPMRALDPRKYANTVTTTNWTVPDTQTAASYTVTNGGSFPTWPTFTISGSGSTPLSFTAASQSVVLNRTLSANAIEIDFQDRTAIENSADVYADIDVTSIWWQLQPGGQSVQVGRGSSSGTLSVTVEHRDAWI